MSRLSRAATALGALALLIAVGAAYALGSSSSATIRACVHHNGRGLYIARKCAKHDKRLTWSVQGPPGASGAAGATGPAGATGAAGATGPPGPSNGPAGGALAGSYPNPTIASGAVTSSTFASGATAPNATDLAGASASDYGAVMSGQVTSLSTSHTDIDFGAPSGISAASPSQLSAETLSPNIDLRARDVSFQLTMAPGSAGNSRVVGISINGKFPGGNSCVIAGSATSCTIRGPISVPAGSTMMIVDEPAGAPAAASLLFGFRLTEQ